MKTMSVYDLQGDVTPVVDYDSIDSIPAGTLPGVIPAGILPRKFKPGTLVRLLGDEGIGYYRVDDKHGATVEDPRLVTFATVELHCEVGDVVVGAVDGYSLPERVRVTRIVKREVSVIDGDCTYWMALVEGVPTDEELTPRRDVTPATRRR